MEAYRYDGIIIDEIGNELGAVEVSATNVSAEKVKKDTVKLLDALHDMILELQRYAGAHGLSVKGLTVVGVQNYGTYILSIPFFLLVYSIRSNIQKVIPSKFSDLPPSTNTYPF
jgi:hypothetical protein